MIKLVDLLREDGAGEEAKRRGLKHIGFGRYTDPSKPRKVVAKSVKGRLVAVNPDVKPGKSTSSRPNDFEYTFDAGPNQIHPNFDGDRMTDDQLQILKKNYHPYNADSDASDMLNQAKWIKKHKGRDAIVIKGDPINHWNGGTNFFTLHVANESPPTPKPDPNKPGPWDHLL